VNKEIQNISSFILQQRRAYVKSLAEKRRAVTIKKLSEFSIVKTFIPVIPFPSFSKSPRKIGKK